jgi:regulator of sigma E protease
LNLELLFYSIVPFFGILMGLIVIHEAAHYFTAKLFGVKVLEAGIGLPPRIWGFRWRDTDYTLNAIPLGAFVRMLGEEDPNAEDPAEPPDHNAPTRRRGNMNLESLAAKPKWQRTIIIGSGAFINFVAAVVLFTISLMIPHDVSVGGAQIASVAPTSPAEQAGLLPGDQILSVNGRTVENTGDAGYFIRLSQGREIDFKIKRDDPREGSQILMIKNVYARWNPQPHLDECGVEQIQGPTGISIGAMQLEPVSWTPEELTKLKESQTTAAREYQQLIPAGSPAFCFGGADFGFRGLSEAQCSVLGADEQAEARALRADVFPNAQDPCYVFEPPTNYVAKTQSQSLNPFDAFTRGVRMSFESIVLTRNQIWSLIRGFNGASPVTGPVGIAQVTGEVVDQAGWLPLLTLAASISMSLALFNALPLPMVDGGRLFFIFIEFIRGGKRIAPEKEAMVHFVGFVALILFALVVTYFDVMRIVGGDSILR